MNVRIGYKASAEQFGPVDLLRFAELADELGFDSVAISDHLQPWTHHGGHAPYSLSWLGAAAQRTKRVTLGTSVLTPTFRHHPAVVAQAAATLACLTPQRIWLGVGSGESLNESTLGVVWPDSAERFARLKEAVELMQRLWTEERVSFDGRFYSTRHATLYDRPPQPVPLLIAAAGPSAARLAGRVADGMICTSGKDMALYRDTLLPAFRDGAARTGRDAGSLQLAIEIKLSFDSDPRRALADTRNWAALALSPEQKRDVDDPLEMERLAADLPDEVVGSHWIIADDADTVVAGLQPYVELGFTHLIFHAPGTHQERFLQLFASQVMPLLRGLSA
ncbi:MAG: glucose-6-phosphate dehydrogenase (coenzyme-F420) [Candidatus Dormibacteraeota bacterium]|nr:glucose-6-phosphate dehydrogenase (coenzyme-F420) [Candidatus Dormibacteraeota bacterium]